MISKNVLESFDIRQSKQWVDYMQAIGWRVEKVGQINLFIKKFPLLPFSMIKVQHQKGKIDFKKIDEIAKKNKTLAIIIEPHNSNFEKSQFKSNGFADSKLLYAHSKTYKIDLTQSEKNIWKNFSENAKRNIQKASKNNINIIILENKKSDIKTKAVFYDLMHQLEKIKKIYTLPQKEFYKKADCFKDHSIFLFAYHKNQPIAGLWLSVFNGTVTYMHTGINEEGYRLNANYLLVWEGIKWAKKEGIKIWDFDAVFDERYSREHPRWRGFSEFKSRFHGILVEYPKPQIKFYNLFFRLLYLWSTKFTP